MTTIVPKSKVAPKSFFKILVDGINGKYWLVLQELDSEWARISARDYIRTGLEKTVGEAIPTTKKMIIGVKPCNQSIIPAYRVAI